MKNKYLRLFSSTFYLSAFTFGGGYVILPLMKKKFVDELNWIGGDEMLNFTAIAQSSPGPVAVNAAVLIGYQIAGMRGALISILGTVLPPLIIISAISLFYSAFRESAVVAAALKGMQAGVAAVISDAVFGMGKRIVKDKDILSNAVMICVFILTYFFHVNVILTILACGAFGVLRYVVSKHDTNLQSSG